MVRENRVLRGTRILQQRTQEQRVTGQKPLCAKSPKQLAELDGSVPCQARTRRVKVRRGSISLAQPDWTPGRKVQKEQRSDCFAATTVTSPILPFWSSSCGLLRSARPLTRPRSVPVAPARDALPGARNRPLGHIRAPGSSSRRHLQALVAAREAPPPAKGRREPRVAAGRREPRPFLVRFCAQPQFGVGGGGADLLPRQRIRAGGRSHSLLALLDLQASLQHPQSRCGGQTRLGAPPSYFLL